MLLLVREQKAQLSRNSSLQLGLELTGVDGGKQGNDGEFWTEKKPTA